MSYDLYFWKLKKRSDLGVGAAYLCLVEGVPCDDFARLPRKHLVEKLTSTFNVRDDVDEPDFIWHIDKRHVAVEVPFSRVDAVVPALLRLAEAESLVAFDPQERKPSPADEETVAAMRGSAADAIAATNVEAWERQAAAGDPVALNELGNAYGSGDGVKKDEARAVELYQRAADLSHVPAMLNLAACLLEGNGIRQDGPRALEWYNRAAEAGCAAAFVRLAMCYREGQGVPKDAEKARLVLESALVCDQCEVAFTLGEMYAAGEGGPASRDRAIEMFTLARSNRHPEAYLALKKLGAAPDD